MLGQVDSRPEDRLFDALGAIFELEPSVALEISKMAACQIAAYVADVGAISREEGAIDNALNRIAEMQDELAVLSTQLTHFKDRADVPALH